MLNKYLLSFKSTSLELEYRQSQEPIIKQEFTAFTLQASLFLVFFSVYYFKGTAYFYSVLASTICLCLLIISFKFIIDKNPHYANYLLPILQILMGLIQVIDYILPYDDSYYVDNPEPDYNWFYGFSSCYYHMAILIQGYVIWPQVVVLSAILVAYISYSHYPSLTYASLFLSFISVLIGMIVIKYTIERNKRQEFLHYRERKRWFKIIESTLHQSIITSIIQLRQQIERSCQIKVKLKFNQQLNILNLQDYRIKELIVNIKLNEVQLNEFIKTYLLQPTYFNSENCHTQQVYKQFKMIDKSLGGTFPLKALSLVCLKLILWRHGVTNQIQIKDKQSYKTFRFSLLCH